jgi:hypothetical protein
MQAVQLGAPWVVDLGTVSIEACVLRIGSGRVCRTLLGVLVSRCVG